MQLVGKFFFCFLQDYCQWPRVVYIPRVQISTDKLHILPKKFQDRYYAQAHLFLSNSALISWALALHISLRTIQSSSFLSIRLYKDFTYSLCTEVKGDIDMASVVILRLGLNFGIWRYSATPTRMSFRWHFEAFWLAASVLIFYGYGRSHSRAFETFSVQQKSSKERAHAHSSIHVRATIKTCSRQFCETIEEIIEILLYALFIVDHTPYRHELASETGWEVSQGYVSCVCE